jgi:hypothetical protein
MSFYLPRAATAWFIGASGAALLSLLIDRNMGLRYPHIRFVLLLSAVSIMWNLATSALLLTVLSEPKPILGQILKGFYNSWRLKFRMLPIVVVQLLLLGMVTFPPRITTEPLFSQFDLPPTWAFWKWHVFWAGDYRIYSSWIGAFMEDARTEPVPVTVTILSIVFSFLAVAIKLKIARELLLLNHVEENRDRDSLAERQNVQPIIYEN